MGAELSHSTNIPRVGMLATVRNRRALVTAVDTSFPTPEGSLHLVQLDYTDTTGTPQETVIWEYETNTKLLEPTNLPRVEQDLPMQVEEFLALQRATRWTALSPYQQTSSLNSGNQDLKINPTKAKNNLFSAPLFGAVQVEDFQLFPLSQALLMPRISLLISDDVGLGKTIEAGLIMTELLLRRRIGRILIVCPAALRKQWQKEMKDKFSLSFDIVDRAETHSLQKRLGLDANPWRTFPRIITSSHYLKQPDVLEQFRGACTQPQGSANLPWDLLVVDEVHNLMPSNFGQDSDLAQMLRFISPWFEHKLFLSATPHNGHTRCFTGLLEQLDPVRFTQTSEINASMQERIAQVVIRRLKREINQQDLDNGKTPRFGDRRLEPIPLYFGREEKLLSLAFAQFRSAVKSLMAEKEKNEQIAGSFALEVLNKRLLSCPYTFAQSWQRFQEGIAENQQAETIEVNAVKQSILEDLDDDLEIETRLQYATKTTGAWLKPLIPYLTEEIENINQALANLGLLGENFGYPTVDERWERLKKLIQDRLRDGKKWKTEERLVIFTEYKNTLDYLESRLKAEFSDDDSFILALYGGMNDPQREAIKQSFNNPYHPVRILVATDAASEGLNLQETARYLLHQDIPWNPAKLDQRNGRLDRHGQARDVVIFHFTSEDNADLRFLGRVVEKVNAIREELGSMEAVFDAAFQRRFEDLTDSDLVLEDLNQAVKQQQGKVNIPRNNSTEDLSSEIEEFKQELDLTPETLKSTLEIALGLGIGGQKFDGPDSQGRLRLKMPLPPNWESLVDDCLRIETDGGQKGGLPAIVFDPTYFMITKNDHEVALRDRPVFRPSPDTVLLHLGHPLFHQALALFARARFPGGSEVSVSRWLLRYGDIPQGAEALLLLTVEELAINELREPFHHWVTTLRFPIINGELGNLLPHIPAGLDTVGNVITDKKAIEFVQELWTDIEGDIKKKIKDLTATLTTKLNEQLKINKQDILQQEKDKFKTRIQEVNKAMKETTLKKLEQEKERILKDLQQLSLFPEYVRQEEEKLRNLEDELQRRQGHYRQLLCFLEQEQKRVLEGIIPQRHQMNGNAQIFPVTVEFRLPFNA
jgi:superfamily II DNA or RNA helicase